MAGRKVEKATRNKRGSREEWNNRGDKGPRKRRVTKKCTMKEDQKQRNRRDNSLFIH